MGRYSSSDEEYSRKLKKKKKRRSRSASSSDTRYSSSKHKKSKRKHKHRSRSRSRSEDRYSKRDRSAERGRRSRSRGRRSRSTERRRSRSLNRSKRSRSYSRGRRSRSDSRSRYSSRKHSSSQDRTWRSSESRSKSRSRRSSPERRRGLGSGTFPTDATSRSESNTLDSIPGFTDMTPAEQAQARLKMALKAAAMADGKLKEQAGATQSIALDPIDSKNFTDAVALIESDGFVPTAFKSSRASRSHKDGKDVTTDLTSHDQAMFGAVGSSVIFSKTDPFDKTTLDDNPESIVDASLSGDPEEKMKRWIQKLAIMRRKKMEGDILPY